MKILNDMVLNDPENKLVYEKAIKEIDYDYSIKGYKAKDAIDKRTFGYEKNIEQANALEMAGVESELGMKKLGVEQQGRKEIAGIEQAGMSTRLNKSIANQWDIATMNEMGRNDRANLVDSRMRELATTKEAASSPLVKSYMDDEDDYNSFIQKIVPDKKGNYLETDLSLAENMYIDLVNKRRALLNAPNISDKDKDIINGIGLPLQPDIQTENRTWKKDRTFLKGFTASEPTIADTSKELVQSANESTINESAVKIGYTWGKARMDSDGWTLKQVSDALATSKEMTDADRLEAIKRLDNR